MSKRELYRILNNAYEGSRDILCYMERRKYRKRYLRQAARFATATRKQMNRMECEDPDLREAVLEGNA